MHLIWIAATLVLPLARPGVPADGSRSPAPIARMALPLLAKQMQQQAQRSIPERIAYWSAQFSGTPYFTPREGEPAPVGLHLAGVDCETYVEQVLAMSLSPRFQDVGKTLNRLRYDGGRVEPRYRHYTVVRGWLEKNRQAGWLEDITRKVGGRLTKTVNKDLTPNPRWRSFYRARFAQLGPLAPKGTARLDYIPLSRAGEIVRRIPSGTVMHIVSRPHPRSPYLVNHVGFVILLPPKEHRRRRTHRPPRRRPKMRMIFRHASQSPKRRRVEDRSLRSYLEYIAETPSGPEMRKGLGIHLSRAKIPPAKP